MSKEKLFKNIKSVVALAAIATLTMTSVVPAATVNNLAAPPPQEVEQKASTSKLRNVMYYGDWSIWGGEGNFFPKDIPVDKLTHLNLAFMDFTKDGELVFCDKDANIGHPLGNAGVTYGDINGGIINEYQSLREKNPNLKIGTSLGGWSKSNNFTWVARNPQTRAKFIKNVLDFMEYANLDFVDFDWEYPGEVRAADKVDNKNDMGNPDSIPADKENYITMLKEFRVALDAKEKILDKKYEMSAALPMAHEKTNVGINVNEMFKVLNFGNIMTYDAAGAWSDTSGHQTALYDNPNDPFAGKGFTVDSSIKKYIELGAPSEKLVIGAAYYTRGWEKVSNDVPDKNLPGLFGKATQIKKDSDGTLSYGATNYAPVKSGDGGRNSGVWGWRNQDELKAKYPGIKEYWDDTAKAPYMYNEKTGAFFTYDNPRSIAEKTKYVKDNNLGGMIAWMASQDKQTDSTKRDELTKATKEGLFGKDALPTYKIVQPKVYAKASVTSSKPAWGNGGALSIDLKNDCKIETSGQTIQLTETAAKTLKHTKLYIKTNGVKITGGEYPAPAVKEENGYYVLSFDGSEQKLIKPGASMKFNLRTDKVLNGLDGIVSIEMTQRMHANGPEFGRVTLY
ncbi:chitinase [Clostridium sp. CF011]|uniref:glycosyl hydrolase family 18 protein n=1 Tax=Clostridium sp. CF011 TaxID=2843318 RepID=UPI001C0D1623|nr:glycosyl hydrolase family 18 protein [Clostridium sp. CF011]MBU3091020.1 chitinase [Clostridium sp. CF011]WAG69058.1 chitinase [Clostridium sp. CF011]